MAGKTVNPTRMELTRLKGRLKTARRGHKLLKDKRDELMKQFLEIVRRNRQLRAKVEQGLKEANDAFTVASAVMGPEMLEQSLLRPQRSVSLDVDARNIMSVNVPVFTFHTEGGEGSAPALRLRPDQRRAGRGAGEDAGGVRRYAGAGAGGEIHAAAGTGHRKDPPPRQRAGVCDDPGNGEEHPLYYDEAG